MLKFLRSTTLTAAVAASAIFSAPREANAAFNVDCAMLLCLAGGWPKSAECTLAYATFIRRVTPWPIEPPLQIWRCPMGASYEGPLGGPMQRFYDAIFPAEPLQSQPTGPIAALMAQPAVLRLSGGTADRLPQETMLHLIQDYSDENIAADIDMSDPVYSFVRSIHVFHAEANKFERNRDGECVYNVSIKAGTYGEQGDFHWQRSSIASLPESHYGLENFYSGCRTTRHRSILIDWTDYQGNYGYEQVNY
tara:strand:+ start:1157 stop:1906 length:750 start_codon:yes stop_codon:yes gene_type:complete